MSNPRCDWSECPYNGVIRTGQKFSQGDTVTLHLECLITLRKRAKARTEEEESA